LPNNQGIILCVNHVNALIDAAVLQASTDKEIRALARDGLFKNPFLKPILNMVGSVPIYRRETEQSDTSKNQDTFARCYELLANNETLVIFPEGQSHSKSFVQDIKTGAARMALGAIQANGVAPIVIPVGMTFHRQKSFRTEVLVSYGEPINLTVPDNMTEYDAVCDVCGMQHLHHSKRYQPVLFTLYILRILAIVLIGFPIALWGIINSIIPYTLTQFFTKKLTRKVDQHDTTWVMLGMLFFGIFWGLQCRYVGSYSQTAIQHEYQVIND